jgi:hypothetical protein
MDTTLSQRTTRDTDVLDRGYHYAVLDYILKNVDLTSTLRIPSGVAVAVGGSYGVDLRSGSSVVSEGLSERMNRLTRWHNVQEQSAAEGNGGPFLKITSNYGSGRPVISVRFTELTAPARSGIALLDIGNSQPFASLNMEFCQLRNVGLPSLLPQDSSSVSISLRNNLFERSKLEFYHSSYSQHTPLAVTAYNNLIWKGAISITYDSGMTNPQWTLKDNLIDGATETLAGTGYGFYVSLSHNGSTTGTAITLNGTNPKPGLNPDYQTGTWGKRYYPASGTTNSLAALIDTGSRTRELAGLYHFTVKTGNLSREGADALTTVDIGNHYVGLNSLGLPYDSDGDGIPDYVEDTNGNNTPDTGESSLTSYNSSNGFSVSTAFSVFTPLQ